MNKAPDIITGKDLDYLSDMFEWNYGAYKRIINYTQRVKDEEIKQTLIRSSELFMNNMKQVLNILNGGQNE